MISITSLDDLQSMVDDYLTHDAFVYDTETVPQDPTHSDHRGDWHRNQVVWISFATDGRADVLPLGHPNGEFIRAEYPLNAAGLKRVAENRERERDGRKLLTINDKYHRSIDPSKAAYLFTEPPAQLHWGAEVREILAPLFSSDLLKIGHNLGFDLKTIAKHIGFVPKPPYANTAMAGFLLNSRNQGKMRLNDCVAREIGYPMVKGVGKKIEAHSFAEVEKYTWLDSRYDWFLWLEYEQQLKEAGLWDLWTLEMDVLEVVTAMEMTGAPIKEDRLRETDAYLKQRVQEVTAEIYKIVGHPFNVDSNAELGQALFLPKKDGGLGLKPKILTPGGKKIEEAGGTPELKHFSVAEKALDALAGSHPVVEQVILHSDLQKLISGFTTPYLGGEDNESLIVNGRIHASFRPDGAITGRFTSKSPNLQQVPVRSADGKVIRSCFSVEDLEGLAIVRADYSQIEPRILTDMCRDPRLLKVYLEGGDIYTELAAPFGLSRDAGKVLFLSVAYGTGPETLANAVKISITESKEIIYDQFPREFPKIYSEKKRVVLESKRRKPPHVKTMLGRRIFLPDLLSNNQKFYRRAERQAFNGAIQGSAADINKVGLVQTHHAIAPLGGQVFLTVHDEILALAPEDRAEEIAVLVKESMEAASILQVVPLLAEVSIVQNWAQAK